jgi:hypothetical protein
MILFFSCEVVIIKNNGLETFLFHQKSRCGAIKYKFLVKLY